MQNCMVVMWSTGFDDVTSQSGSLAAGKIRQLQPATLSPCCYDSRVDGYQDASSSVTSPIRLIVVEPPATADNNIAAGVPLMTSSSYGRDLTGDVVSGSSSPQEMSLMPAGYNWDSTYVRLRRASAMIGASAVAIDNKIEQAMDLVKSHLMFAVREEVEVLKEQIKFLMERNEQLEHENSILRAAASRETLDMLNSRQPPLT